MSISAPVSCFGMRCPDEGRSKCASGWVTKTNWLSSSHYFLALGVFIRKQFAATFAARIPVVHLMRSKLIDIIGAIEGCLLACV